jgi:hypothetical protein
MNVVWLKRRWFRECKEKRPALYENILRTECPDGWGLPSYRDTRSCPDHSCEQCWKEALRDDNCIENKKAEKR